MRYLGVSSSLEAPMSLRALSVLGALVLAACSQAANTTQVPSTDSLTTAESVTTAVQQTDVTQTPPSTAVPTSPPSTEQKDPLTLQIEELMAITEEIRELAFLETPDITVLTEEGVAERILELFDEDTDPEEFAASDELYTVLGLLDRDDDLLEMLSALQTEQVVAFYATESKELVAPASAEQLTPLEKLTLVHELTHALTDQHFDLYAPMERLDAEQRYDEASAFRALAEGDATVVETLYLQQLPRADQLLILQSALSFESPVFDASPSFLQDSLLFPYVEGRDLVTDIWTADGFQGVDDAYFDIPATTEHVYRPGTYFAGEGAAPVTLPALSLNGYDLIEASTWGYLGFQTMFDQVLDRDAADTAAEGWGGDRYELHWNGRDMVFVLSYTGDTTEDAAQLHQALDAFIATSMAVGPGEQDGAGESYAGEDYAFLSRQDDTVVFVAASEPSAGSEARQLFPDF